MRARVGCVIVALVISTAAASAQSPQTPPQTAPPVLNGLVFLSDPAQVVPGGWTTAGVVIDVSRVQELADPRAMREVLALVGKPYDMNDLTRLAFGVSRYFDSIGQPFVRVTVPPQTVVGGIVQVLVIRGHVGAMTVRGNRWFRDGEINRAVGLRAGDVLDARQLDAAVRRLNENPYRHVAPVMQAGDELGATDVTLQVEDRLPLSPNFSIGNTGNSTTGGTQMTAGLDWGDGLWRGDDLNFHYTTGTNLHVLHQYSAGYIAHLPWGDQITVGGGYARTAPVSPAGVAIGTVGTMANASPRYIRTFGGNQLSAGFDWKRTNNNLLFGGQSVFASSATIDQFTFDYSRGFPDQHGSTSVGASLVYSPGGLSAGNSDIAFDEQRAGAKSRYAYVRLNADRMTTLAHGFAWDVRGLAQLTPTPLLSSEQIYFGGEGSVRGFEPFATARDNGLIVNIELRLPPLNLPRHLNEDGGNVDALGPFVFADYGAGELENVDHSVQQLASAGAGVRYTLAHHVSASLSYGFILQHVGLPTTATGRAQFQVQALY